MSLEIPKVPCILDLLHECGGNCPNYESMLEESGDLEEILLQQGLDKKNFFDLLVQAKEIDPNGYKQISMFLAQSDPDLALTCEQSSSKENKMRID